MFEPYFADLKNGEIFLPFPYAPGYYISNLGRWCHRRKSKPVLLTSPEVNTGGYMRGQLFINGKRKHFFTHISVVLIFGDCYGKTISWLEGGTLQDKGLSIDHIDGNKFNNQVDNLEIVTHSENVKRCKAKLKKDKSFEDIF